ncbi:MAG: hypothetical protein R2711_09075 [Acidimicrobiales bacterium]
MDDSVAMAQLVEREVRTGERDGQATRIVVARRRYGTDVDDLWTALTDLERLPRWFLPVSGDLREGGTYLGPRATPVATSSGARRHRCCR